MFFKLNRLDEKEFEKLNIPVISSDRVGSLQFAVLEFNDYTVGLVWQSSIIEPEVNKINEFTICVGIDLSFAIIDFQNRIITLNLELESFYYTTLIQEDYLLVISEITIYKIERKSYIYTEYGLPDIITEFNLDNNILSFDCMDGTKGKIKL